MKKRLGIILSVVMIAVSLTACSGSQTPAQNAAGNAEPEQKEETTTQETEDTDLENQAETPQTRIVVDVWNREVEIPYEVKSIVCLGSMGPRMAAYLDVIDMMAGAEDSDIENESIRYDYSPVYHDALAALPSVGAGGGSGDNNGYAEEIIKAAPDVIIAGFNEDAAEELQSQTGIPVVSIRYRTQGFIDEGFHRAMRVFAETVGAEERCEQVLAYIDECKADLDNRTKDADEDTKLKAYTGAVTFNGRHGFAFTYVNFPAFNAVNARNVADVLLEERTGEAAQTAAESGKAYIGNDGFEVDLEQIVEWDPDIIFLDPGNMDIVNEEYDANPEFYDSLRAVKDGEVYTMPSTNAAGPNITYLLINGYYTGITLYPEAFEDISLEDKAAEIMEMMLGQNFFDKMEEGGLYYGKITLGK